MKKFTLFLFVVGSCNAIHASSFMSDFVNTVKSSVSIVRDDIRDSFFSSPPVQRQPLNRPIQEPSLDRPIQEQPLDHPIQEQRLEHPIQRSSLAHLQKFGWIAEQPYVVAENNRNNDFSVNLAREMYGMSKEDCKRKRAAISEKMKQVFYDPDQAQEEGIPFNTHRMWITSRDKPSEAPVERLKIYLESLKKLKADGWAHHFWCMKKNEIPETMKILQSSEVPVIVHELEEIFPKMNTKFVFDAYYEDRQFCIASDVARQAVIYLYGGIYSDLGTNFSIDMAPLLKAYDYIFWYNGMYLDQTFFGYKKHDPIAKKFLDNLSTLYKMPQNIKALTKEQNWGAQIWGSGAQFMALFDVFSTPQDRFLLVPEGPESLIQINHAQSWQGTGASGNKTLEQSKLDVINLLPPTV